MEAVLDGDFERAERVLGVRLPEFFRGDRRLLHAKVAVGAPGRETPLGEFYVTARFVPDDPFLGAFAFESSAYSRLTEWPGGGIVGIHGTSEPWLLGRAVSHGCVRVSNATALALKPELARDGADGVIDRSQTRDTPWDPVAAVETAMLFGTRVAEPI